MAVFTIFRAVFGYLFLVLIVRIVGRRPGKQLTPFEFVLVFYLGGLTLTGMVEDEVSLTNALCQILAVGVCHYALAWLRFRYGLLAKLLDGVPLILLEHQQWRTKTLSRMGIEDDDVMDMAREQGLKDLTKVKTAVLEAFGEISVLPLEQKGDLTMAEQPFLEPVQDSVPKIDEVAVGEDLEFQRKWWRFEHVIWICFLVILLADVLGLFGRGWLAKAKATDSSHTIHLDYERVERTGTPSIMTLRFGPTAIRDGKIELYVSEDIIKSLGAQRISPQPEQSTVGNGGITYTFSATQTPATVEIALSPSFPGVHQFQMQVAGGEPIDRHVLVVP